MLSYQRRFALINKFENCVSLGFDRLVMELEKRETVLIKFVGNIFARDWNELMRLKSIWRTLDNSVKLLMKSISKTFHNKIDDKHWDFFSVSIWLSVRKGEKMKGKGIFLECSQNPQNETVFIVNNPNCVKKILIDVWDEFDWQF